MKKPSELPLHFIGIGGIGMSGIAEVMLRQGYPVSGSDLTDSIATQRLKQLGANISIGHRATNIGSAAVVVYSSAVRTDNPEMIAAKESRIPTIPRAEMLAEIMRAKNSISVAGTHGKTTTTSMVATVFSHAGWDPTVVIGGRLDSIGGNAKLGVGNFVIAEADESDGSFLKLPAVAAIITNIDNDHMDFYGSLAKLDEAFVQFVGNLPFYGVAWVCGDDPGVRRNLGRFSKPVRTYGFEEGSDWIISNYETVGMGSKFRVKTEEGELVVQLSVPGKHNALNAVAALGLAMDMGIPREKVLEGLKKFVGVKRRFEIKWQNTGKTSVVVDDYGHHPVEVSATLAAARGYWGSKKIRVVFQPHRYTRTMHCMQGFATAFRDADEVILTPIYSAGEEPIPGVDQQTLAKAIQSGMRSDQTVYCAENLEKSVEVALKNFSNDELLIFMGAGSITKVADEFVALLP